MSAAHKFESFTASVFESQQDEIVVGKQPILADYGRELRSAINQLPPEVTRDLMGDYAEPGPSLITSIENAVTMREYSIENAQQVQNLDQSWLNGAQARNLDEQNLGADDIWNAPEF